MNNKNTGYLIQQLREKIGFTQAQLAEKLHISDKTVCKWENGKEYPEVSQLLALADILGITVDELLKGGIEKKAAVPSLYESAFKLPDIRAVNALLADKNLKEKDINGNTFLDCVIKNKQYQFMPFCYKNSLYTIDDDGIFLVDGKNNKDTELALLFLLLIEYGSDNFSSNDFNILLDGTNLARFSKRKYSKAEITAMARMAHKMQKGCFYIFFPEQENKESKGFKEFKEVVEEVIINFGFGSGFLVCENDRSWALAQIGGISDKAIDILIERKIIADNFAALKNYSSEKGFEKYKKFFSDIGIDLLIERKAMTEPKLIEGYCSPKAFEKYSDYYYAVKRSEMSAEQIAAGDINVLYENKYYDAIVARRKKQFKFEKGFVELVLDMIAKGQDLRGSPNGRENSEGYQRLEKFLKDYMLVHNLKDTEFYRRLYNYSWCSNWGECQRGLNKGSDFSPYRDATEAYKTAISLIKRDIIGPCMSESLRFIPNGRLSVEDVLRTGNIKFIKDYFSVCDDWEKDLALNNYKDGDLEIIKALLEVGANFIVNGHSCPPTISDATNPSYQERRDKTKTALTKLQLGLK